MFLCANCRVQVVLCSRCDRGNRYCGRICRQQARDGARRQAARRYQRSRRGRLAHAERTRRWRQRRAQAAQKVTHQGCQSEVADAPLSAWTPNPSAVIADIADLAHAPAHEITPAVAIDTPEVAHLCCRCAAPLGLWVRQGFLRHGRRAAVPLLPRHDHSP